MIRIETGEGFDDETRAALASGRAQPAIALFIDTVLALRGYEDAIGEAAAGTLLETEAPAEMHADALDRAFAAIDAGICGKTRSDGARPARYAELIRLPATLQQAIRDAEARKGWGYAGPGIKSLKLGLSGPVEAEILRISPGAATPVHTHGGSEYTLCLVGGFSDGRGAYGPGDISIADPSVTHQPRADDDGPCFVLAITDAGLKFKGWLGVLQKLTGG